jgi:dihydrodipicolinate reductase
MTMNVAVFGAAGSMGTRVTNALDDDPDYWMPFYMKAGDAGQARL